MISMHLGRRSFLSSVSHSHISRFVSFPLSLLSSLFRVSFMVEHLMATSYRGVEEDVSIRSTLYLWVSTRNMNMMIILKDER